MNKRFSEDFFVIVCKCLILREKKFCARVIFFKVRPLFGSTSPAVRDAFRGASRARAYIYRGMAGKNKPLHL